MKQLSSFKVSLSGVGFLIFVSTFVFLSPALIAQNHVEMQNTGQLNKLELKSGNDLISTVPASSPETVIPIKSYENGSTDPLWTLKFTASGKVFKDVSFADAQVGYIVTELGSVYKSVNGGNNWSSVMNLGFPYYWYGVDALTPDTVVISGFNNQGPINQGVLRWTFDGGITWSPDINLIIPVTAVGWLERIHFFNPDTGIVMNTFSGGCWVTANGGKAADDWTYITINSDLAWFAGNIDAQPSGKVYATGIHFANSLDFGSTWVSGPCADIVFDGGVDFLDDNNLFGWTGGGQISAPVAGWVCRTTDSGLSWSPRLNTFPYPIRAVLFLDENRGWVVGGNLYDEAGGIYSTADGGLTWNLDVSTSAEMFSIELKPVSTDSTDVWCVGSTGGGSGFVGKLYKTRIGYSMTSVLPNPSISATGFALYQNFPNPFKKVTNIEFYLPETCFAKLKVYDMMGKEAATLVNGIEQPGYQSLSFDGSGLKAGIYYVQLRTDNYSETRKLVLER